VQKHVQHILEKLHLETRIAVCIWWYEHRLAGDGSSLARPKPVRTWRTPFGPLPSLPDIPHDAALVNSSSAQPFR
jgi:hypothetical protein